VAVDSRAVADLNGAGILAALEAVCTPYRVAEFICHSTYRAEIVPEAHLDFLTTSVEAMGRGESIVLIVRRWLSAYHEGQRAFLVSSTAKMAVADLIAAMKLFARDSADGVAATFSDLTHCSVLFADLLILASTALAKGDCIVTTYNGWVDAHTRLQQTLFKIEADFQASEALKAAAKSKAAAGLLAVADSKFIT